MATKAQLEQQLKRQQEQLEAMQERLSQATESAMVSVNIKLPQALRDQYRALAAGWNRPMREVMEEALRAYMDEYDAKHNSGLLDYP